MKQNLLDDICLNLKAVNTILDSNDSYDLIFRGIIKYSAIALGTSRVRFFSDCNFSKEPVFDYRIDIENHIAQEPMNISLDNIPKFTLPNLLAKSSTPCSIIQNTGFSYIINFDVEQICKGTFIFSELFAETDEKFINYAKSNIIIALRNYYYMTSKNDFQDDQYKFQEYKEIIARLNQQKYAFDNAAIIEYSDLVGNILYVNKKFTDTFGYDLDEVVGSSYKLIKSDEHSKEFFQDLWKTVKAGKTWNGELSNKAKNGETVWLDKTIVPILNANNRPIQYISIGYDITKLKIAEDNTSILSRMFVQSPVSIVITDKEGSIEYVNPWFEKTTGYSLAEAKGQNPRILKSGTMKSEVYENLWKTISNGEIWQGVFCNKKKNGELFWEISSISAVYDSNNEITHYIGVKDDITKKKESDQKLATTLSLYSATLESISEGVISFNDSKIITGFNNNFIKMWGIQEGIDDFNDIEALFESLSQTVIDKDAFIKKCKIIIDFNESDINDKVYLKNAKVFDFSSKPQVLNEQIIGTVWAFRDITEQTEANDKLIWYTQDLEFAKLSLEEQARKMKATLIELAAAKEKAESATKMKSEFLANMSHEVRTPLNAIIGFSQILNEEITMPKQKAYIESIASSGKNLLMLINDILDLSRIEAGRIELKNESLSLPKLLSEIRDIFSLNISNKKLSMTIDVSNNMPASIIIDEIRLRQVLFNLIGNAIKFTEKGYVKVHVNPQNTDITNSTIDFDIVIEDSGIGIMPSQVDLIFESFFQQTGQNTRKYGGTGLGLSITKRLVELMGGNITVESILCEYSKFIVHFVAIPCQLQKEIPFEQVESSKQIISKSIFDSSTIILINSANNNYQGIVDLFTNSDVEIIFAETCQQVIDFAIQSQPNLILIDLRRDMLECNNFTSVLKNNVFTQDVPLVALTEPDSDINATNFSGFGFDSIISWDLIKVNFLNELAAFLPLKQCQTSLSHNIDETSVGVSKSNGRQMDRKDYDSVLNSLETELYSFWTNVHKHSIISEIREFADKLLEIGNHNDLEIITDYAAQLISQLEHFDFENFPQTLALFPEIVDDFRESAVASRIPYE